LIKEGIYIFKCFLLSFNFISALTGNNISENATNNKFVTTFPMSSTTQELITGKFFSKIITKTVKTVEPLKIVHTGLMHIYRS